MPRAMEKYPWLFCLGDFLQLSPGVGYFGVSGRICLLLPVWDSVGLTQTTFLEMEGVWVAKPCCLHITFGNCHSLNHLRQNQTN